MSIYRQVLEDQFEKLHPMLQKRYSFKGSTTFIAEGTMRNISGGRKFQYPLFLIGTKWELLFPERGKDIPFKIVNTPQIGAEGEQQVHWERVFYFGNKKRYFNALMSLDKGRNMINDYFGEPAVFYSDLVLTVTNTGGLKVESEKQRLVLGEIQIPLPKLLQGIATVTEEYDEEKEVYVINVLVENLLVGRLFAYEGTFRSNDYS